MKIPFFAFRELELGMLLGEGKLRGLFFGRNATAVRRAELNEVAWSP
ncbi:MAG TPA: hypothetical protein VL793_02520 [Patescibacteria group bacterium]|nr:hypothetical protein [Patescibacteria group bacterium]